MEGPVVFKPHKEPHYSNGLMRRQPGLVPLKGPGGWKGESESNELGESQCIQRSNRYSQKKVKSRWFGTWQMVKEQDCKREEEESVKSIYSLCFFASMFLETIIISVLFLENQCLLLEKGWMSAYQSHKYHLPRYTASNY